MNSTNATKYTVFAVAAVVGAAAAYTAYRYLRPGDSEAPPEDRQEPEQEPLGAGEDDTQPAGQDKALADLVDKSGSDEAGSAAPLEGFFDPNHGENQFVSKAAANTRSQAVSGVSYLIAVGLPKGGKTLHGRVQILFTLAKKCKDFVEGEKNDECLFIDYWGKRVKSLTVNGTFVAHDTPNIFVSHKIYIPNEVQKEGPNEVVVEFESSYVTNCEGFQYYKDNGDGTEYVYTELEPDHCHKWVPCFDQPDLKAP
jgi:hypothetical protein